jgi:hypothetical protein
LKSREGEASLESSGRAFQCKGAESKALPEQMRREEGHDESCPYIGTGKSGRAPDPVGMNSAGRFVGVMTGLKTRHSRKQTEEGKRKGGESKDKRDFSHSFEMTG